MAVPVDLRTQAQALLFSLPGSEDLRPGMAVAAYLEIPGKPKTGVEVPRSAVVRFGGATFVYTYEKPELPPLGQKPKETLNEFTRKEVTLDYLDGDKWFITKGIVKGDKVVEQGAHILLSEEIKALIPAGDD